MKLKDIEVGKEYWTHRTKGAKGFTHLLKPLKFKVRGNKNGIIWFGEDFSPGLCVHKIFVEPEDVVDAKIVAYKNMLKEVKKKIKEHKEIIQQEKEKEKKLMNLIDEEMNVELMKIFGLK